MNFLPSRTLTIGIQCTGGILRICLLKQRRKQATMVKICEKEMTAKIVSPDGVILMPKECGEIIKDHLQKAGFPSKGRVVVIVAPDKLYTHLFSFPPATKDDLLDLLKPAMEKVIPEEYESLSVISRSLDTSAEGVHMGVAAVGKDLLQGYLASMEGTGLVIERLTSAPPAIACFTKAMKEAVIFLLVSIPGGPEKGGAVTLFYKGWPIDEAVLLPGTTPEKVLSITRDFVKEYKEKNMPVERIVFWGEAEWEVRLRMEIPDTTISLERATPWLQEKNIHWGGLQAACLAPTAKLFVNFTPPKKNSHGLILMVIGGLLGFAILGAIGYYTYIFFLI